MNTPITWAGPARRTAAACCALIVWAGTASHAAVVDVDTVTELVAAVTGGADGDTINVAAGTYELAASLLPRPRMIIRGAGAALTVLAPAAAWNPGTTGLPDADYDSATAVQSAYLFDLDGQDGVIFADMTLDGRDRLHGAVYSNDADDLEMSGLVVKDFIWSGFRSWRTDRLNVHDCIFEDAGGAYGKTGGAVYPTWVADSSFCNNRFYRSTGSTRNFYGIKGNEPKRCAIRNNTILVNFSIEFPHDNAQDNEIAYNYLTGTVSIPKDGGGSVPLSGVTFHIHHNYFRKSYALEWARNGTEVDHNLFDFVTTDDGGNMVSAWSPLSPGPAKFHNNLIKNPGRGVFWTTYAFNNLSFYNNHVIANTTVTPRTEGLFGLPTSTTFSTITLRDNVFECVGQARPLFRNTASYASVVENNTLINVSDAGGYANPDTGAVRGPTAPLAFTCGVSDEYVVDQWAVAHALAGTTMLSENFADGNMNGWTKVADTTVNGTMNWTVTGGELKQSSNCGTTLSGFGVGTYAWWNGSQALSWADYTFSARLRSSDDDAIGVMFCYVDGNTYYRFLMNKQANTRRLEKKVEGVFTLLASEAAGYVQNQNYSLEIGCRGGQITVKLGGAVLFGGPVYDASIRHGSVALYSGTNAGSYFDDITVKGSLHPLADAFVRAGSYAATNYGSAAIVSVKNSSDSVYDRRGFMRFDLGALSGVSSASLVLQVVGRQSGTTAVPITLYAVADDTWDELSITWNSMPVLGAAIQTVTCTAVGQTLVYDVTCFVNTQLGMGDGIVSFALWDAAVKNFLVDLGSRESAAPPMLELR